MAYCIVHNTYEDACSYCKQEAACPHSVESRKAERTPSRIYHWCGLCIKSFGTTAMTKAYAKAKRWHRRARVRQAKRESHGA